MKLLGSPVPGLGLVLALLPACAPIRFSSQELLLRHRPESDALDVLLLYEGIQTAKPDGIDASSRFTGRVVGGKRELMVFDWPLHLDLDKLVEDLESADPGRAEARLEWNREGLELLEGVRASGSGLYAGNEGRLSLYQRFRVERWSRLVEWFDRSLRIWIAECDADGTLAHRLPLLGAETRAAWVEMSRAKKRWLTIADGGLQVDLPMSSEEVARLFARFLEEVAKAEDDEGSRFFAGLAAPMGGVEAASGRLRLAWKAEDGMVRFRFDGPEGYDEGLAKSMRSDPGFPPKLPAREDLMRSFSGD